jgi:predicted transcriptional regulator
MDDSVDEERPEWMTDTDEEILQVLWGDLIMTPAIIAENIDRSREGVSRRLNTLVATGLVKKHDRGKYLITEDGTEMIKRLNTGTPGYLDDTDPPDEDYDIEDGLEARAEHRRRIENELGVSEEEFYDEQVREVERIRQNPELVNDDNDEVIDMYLRAYERVWERLKKEHSDS